MVLSKLAFEADGVPHTVQLERDPATGGYVVRIDDVAAPPQGRAGLPISYFVETVTVAGRVCTVRAFRLLGGLYERYSITARQTVKTTAKTEAARLR